MKEIILHIGIHKTGSTSIQSSLKGYDDGKTRYARFREANHSVPMYTIFSSNRHIYHIWKKEGLTNEQINKKREEYLKILDTEVSDHSYDRLIISGEDISSLQESDKINLVDYFQSKGVRLKVVCFVRDAASLASSMAQGLIGQGAKSVKSVPINYISRLNVFYNTLPKDDIIVLDFITAVETYGGAVEAFTKIVGIHNVKAKHENESRSESTTKLLYRLNNLPVKTFGSRNRNKARSMIDSEISKRFSLNDGSPVLKKSIFHSNIRGDILTEYNFLKEYCGIEYKMHDTVHDVSEIELYLNDFSTIDNIHFNEILLYNGIVDMQDASIDQMLIELYLKLLHSI